ncbi:hypothetical protein [[Clostridium] polysaccharolyticum]|uniref:Energy-coupling factor transport system substrate-specific component n=1 Tax=[Clostridium] polysaccharolyticum TaxID=29364 RepID=A0A1I0C555_9FIRM|nr:hypothetical protein [[Clostridium] polysaccharolyticum]SET14594.1 hypothetical protein SAMN04487772_10930 [[Clostridium] polysaccharolyticum]
MKRVNVQKMIILAVLADIIFVCKYMLASMPNVELVTFLVILSTLLLGKHVVYTVILYVFLEICTYGLGFWTVGYAVLWPGLVVITCLFRTQLENSNSKRAILAGIFGFAFDLVYAVVISLLTGLRSGIAYFISGLGFSAVHMISNYLIMWILGNTIYNAMKKARDSMFF